MPTLNLIIGTDPRPTSNRPYVQTPSDWRVYHFDEIVRTRNGRIDRDDEKDAYTILRQIAHANLATGLNVAVIAPFDSIHQFVDFVDPLVLFPRLRAVEDENNYKLELPVTVIVTKPTLNNRDLVEKFNKRGE